jgi:hypothetical protein
MLPVFAYIRISRDRTGAGLNIADQLNDIRPAAQSAGHHIAEVYADNDMSAYSGKPRPDYLRLLDDIRAGRWKAGWAWHTDRLHRSPLELEDWITACEPHGTALWTVKAGPIDLTTPSGRLVARQLGARRRRDEIAALADDPDWSLEELRAMRRAAAERVAQIEARMSRAVRPRVVEGIAGRPVEEVLALWGDMGLEARRALVRATVRVRLVPVSRQGRSGDVMRDEDMVLEWLL